MAEHLPVEIECPGCGRDTLLLREPRYDGFTRVGEWLSCASCGHEFASEEDVPYRHRRKARVFTEEDRSRDPRIFGEDEADRLCRHCGNYVVNPFMQWCALHRKEVEATDTCPQFQPAACADHDTPDPLPPL